jgi:hypothetical protein
MAKGLTKAQEEQLREIKKILKGFSIDILARRGETSKTVAVETWPLTHVSSINPTEKTITIWHSSKGIQKALEEMEIEKGENKTTEISYDQFRKLVGELLIEMFTKFIRSILK